MPAAVAFAETLAVDVGIAVETLAVDVVIAVEVDGRTLAVDVGVASSVVGAGIAVEIDVRTLAVAVGVASPVVGEGIAVEIDGSIGRFWLQLNLLQQYAEQRSKDTPVLFIALAQSVLSFLQVALTGKQPL
ncbi:hypothetical protein OS493_037242 [Desmophyllum pertusum]|uniref:Uncharacterized protein n=1 Tax=Desmophyllum pertusum TaxID=174260 RepID=A0A9W9Z6U4_9CNID|nr:hypothetical protein OS493_037242 [Desmophyllum pertusum]